MSLHRESEMFSYWERGGGGTGRGLWQIITSSLGQVIVDHMDSLSRNAYFSHPYPVMGLSSATGFDGIDTDDKMTTELLDNVWLTMRDTPKVFSALPVATDPNSIFCITTAGVVHDLKREVGTGPGALAFVPVSMYQGGTNLMTGELGSWRGIRFIESQFAKLHNTGTITHQTEIKAAVKPGDGAPDPATTKVEGAYMVGQPSATHYITVQDASGFAPGDRVTVHKLRHTAPTLAANGAKGVLNGVVFTDPMAQDLVIHSIDTSGGAGAHTITFREPYMMIQEAGKGLETDLGSGVYGYVTLGQTIHTALFLDPSRQGIIAGVAQPPVIYTPKPIDDYESMFRVAYDFYLKYQMWDARAYHLAFLTGANGFINKFYR